jgi:ABC-type molybdate transport system substrate-binding protein
MKKLAAILILLAALLGGVALYQHRTASRPGATSLTVYCAAGLKKPVEAIAQQYQRESGTEVRLQYGGTGTLLSQLRVAKMGDIFIAADDGVVADAKKDGLIREVLALAKQKPVIGVRTRESRGRQHFASRPQGARRHVAEARLARRRDEADRHRARRGPRARHSGCRDCLGCDRRAIQGHGSHPCARAFRAL